MIIDKVFAVAWRVGIKFVFRDFFAVLPRHRHFLPMKVQTGQIETPCPMGKNCPVAESFSDCKRTREGRFSLTAVDSSPKLPRLT